MAVQRSIAATAQGLSQRIIRYVETEYLGKTPELLAACKQDLEQPGVLYQPHTSRRRLLTKLRQAVCRLLPFRKT